MSKEKSVYICQKCHFQSPKWLGKCPECESWNMFIEEIMVSRNSLSTPSSRSSDRLSKVPLQLQDIGIETFEKLHSGISEFDRVLGNGITKGSLTLIGGEPGIGKSTLLGKVAGSLASEKKYKVLYVSGEESLSQVAQRIKRITQNPDSFYVLHENIWQNIKESAKQLRPDVIILDSIQTTLSNEIQSPPGTVSQIREVTYELMNFIKSEQMTAFIVGHITKEGSIAGPKILEHMVDTVIYFEGDQFGHYRLLRAIKNRFGNTNEVGVFEMMDSGLEEVSNPGQYFLQTEIENCHGRCLSCVMEGTRSILIEIQALVVENKFGNGRRTTHGLDHNRLSMMVAVIEKYFSLPLGFNDIYLNVAGGFKVNSRETDLAVIAAILSSYKSNPISSEIVFLGEVGLTGEVRSVPFIENRLKDLGQLNYKKVVVPYSVISKMSLSNQTALLDTHMEIVGIKQIKELEIFI